MSEGKDTTVIYVWDIYDPAGNRLHRINGQQKEPSVNKGEGWAAVAPATMKGIATSAAIPPTVASHERFKIRGGGIGEKTEGSGCQRVPSQRHIPSGDSCPVA